MLPSDLISRLSRRAAVHTGAVRPKRRRHAFELLESRRVLAAYQVFPLPYFANDGGEPGGLTVDGSTLFGVTSSGGANANSGTLFEINSNGTGYQILKSFGSGASDGTFPVGDLLLSGSTLFGATESGGASGGGTLFKINTDGTGYSVIHSFAGGTSDGAEPIGSLIQVGSTLFGTTLRGGSASDGTVFKINTDGTGFGLVHTFTGGASDGQDPGAGLTFAGGTLFGTTEDGGASSNGTVFSMNTDGTAFQLLHSFAGGASDGADPSSTLALVGSTLFGATFGGGSGSFGTLFSISTSGSGFQLLHVFSGTSDGSGPDVDLAVSGSTLYGATESGGADGVGTAFSISTSGSGFTLLHTFTGQAADGGGPFAGLAIAGSTLFGTAEFGGAANGGTLFALGTNGSGFQVLHAFGGGNLDGSDPVSGLVASGSTLFGTASSSGGGDAGTVFEINADGTGLQTLHQFNGIDGNGDEPNATLLLSGSTLYGTTEFSLGGDQPGPDGTVYKLNTNGTGFQVLHEFSGTVGADPVADLALSGSTLFGTASFGGSSDAGIVFAVNTDGTGFQVLHTFTAGATDGERPLAGLTLVGSTLFGTTEFGGTANLGTLFSINTDGTGFQLLHSFTGGASDGSSPAADLTLVGSTLYGTTKVGGSANEGAVFSINTDGTGFQLVHSFVAGASDGGDPAAGLTLVGSTLFGTTLTGGSAGDGTVYSINTNGTNFQVLHSFAGGTGDGSGSEGGLTLVGSTLFGTATSGGIANNGVVFALPTDVPTITNATTVENTQTTSGLVITPGGPDAGAVTNFQIISVSGGTLFRNDGTTPIAPSSFITTAQGAAGLKFTPTLGSTVTGVVTVQESTSASSGGLIGETAQATIAVTAATSTSLPAPDLYTLFNTSIGPTIADRTDDANAVQLGVEFAPDTDGYVNGIYFFKGAGAASSGQTIELWKVNGQTALQAPVTVTNQTSFGWQFQAFPTPVYVQAGQQYIAAYFAPNGNYADDQHYFPSNIPDGGPISVSGSFSAYNYGAAANAAYPSSSFANSNYWVDPQFAPMVQAIIPAGGATGVTTTPTITVQFFNGVAMNPASLTTTSLTLSNTSNGGSSAVPTSTPVYNAATKTVTFTPNSPLAPGADYTITVLGGAGGVQDANGNTLSASVTAVFQTTSLAGPAPYSIWADDFNAIPGTADNPDPAAVNLGLEFAANADGYINGIRFYQTPADSGVKYVDLWTAQGALVASASVNTSGGLAGNPAGGTSGNPWREVDFAQPAFIQAGQVYIASYYTQTGNYADDVGYFSRYSIYSTPSLSQVSGIGTTLTALGGVYNYGQAPAFPNAVFDESNYWVDLSFTPVIESVVPGNGATGITPNTPITVQFAVPMKASTIIPANFSLTNAANAAVAFTLGAYNATNNSVTLTPTAETVNTTYTLAIAGGAGGIQDNSGNAINGYLTTFTTESLPPSGGTVFSLLEAPAAPAGADNRDPNPVELGMKFQSSAAGWVTGAEFYKTPLNTGTHTATLWSADGAALTPATMFTSESASGWQTVNFAQPVFIEPNTTYVISYHTSTGYQDAIGFFSKNPAVNGPLMAMASSSISGNGVFAYGAGGIFPSDTYNASNYWVDVLFQAQ